MKLHLRPILSGLALFVLVLASGLAALAQTPAPKGGGERQEWEQLRKRFSDPDAANLLAGSMWALTHAYESKSEVDKIMKLLGLLGDSLAKQDPALLDGVGGARGFKESVAAFLDSDDDIVAGFAATLLAACGDARYAPAIARLLERKDRPEDEEKSYRSVTSRGSAAIALSLLGARAYVPRFVRMLRSPNRYDRSGVVYALGRLGAREHAKEIAALLSDEKFKYEDDDSPPIYALAEMGATAEYAGEIAKVLDDELRGEAAKTAAYALASIGAKQYAKNVAKLLEQKYRRGDAAKALALMGAEEYKVRIAQLLDDESELVRADALLALAIFNAREYIPRIARFLKDPGFLSHYAAEALVLMGEMKYARECVPLVESAYQHKLYLGADMFHPLVERQLVPFKTRFAESFLKMKDQLSK